MEVEESHKRKRGNEKEDATTSSLSLSSRAARLKRFRSADADNTGSDASVASDQTAKEDEILMPSGSVMQYSLDELASRRGLRGARLSMMDRKKFSTEFDGNKLGLSEEEIATYDENPHLQQVFAQGRQFIDAGRPLDGEDRSVRYPDEDNPSPTMPYKRRRGEAKTVEHWGQRKLLLSDIEFLTEYGEPGCTVVYAGVGANAHTDILASNFFPEYKWVLIDSCKFNHKYTANVTVRKERFCDDIAKEFADTEKVLFIGDPHSASDPDLGVEVRHDMLLKDLQCLKAWILAMGPKAALIKFRLPYQRGSTEFLDGTMYLPVFGAPTSSETRLAIPNPSIDRVRVYDHSWYEDVMFYHNTVRRTTYFHHNVDGEGLDHCYDCASEIYIFRDYLQKMRKGEALSCQSLDWMISILSFNLSRTLGKRTLLLE